jgi:hypothetical protein
LRGGLLGVRVQDWAFPGNVEITVEVSLMKSCDNSLLSFANSPLGNHFCGSSVEVSCRYGCERVLDEVVAKEGQRAAFQRRSSAGHE